MASIPIPRYYRTPIYIPSKNDGCMLEVCLSIPTTISSQPRIYTGVVIAHPYGPLGGSYHNNVVGNLLQWFETYQLQAAIDDSNDSGITATMSSSSASLETGATPAGKKSSKKKHSVPLSCVICAFNFRGCGRSKGRTSWFGGAERDDYQTIVDFLQSGSHSRASPHLGHQDSDIGWSGKVYDDTGRQIDSPRLPFFSRFILCGYSYGGMVASTIPPPLRNPADPSLGHLPTTYILVSYPAGVSWFLTCGAHRSFAKRAREILFQGDPKQETAMMENGERDNESRSESGRDRKNSTIKAYFITGGQDQFTSPNTLLTWLKTNTGLSPPPVPTPRQAKGDGSNIPLTLRRPDGAIHLDVLEDVDHFWLDREQELLDKLQRWWTETHV
ncbi:hypothetical protein BCR41DRAFT_343894 [Lobosporangium transversale]|uniref:Alpha/Beta hydrolase protein n=1 Tax=Lobosporangium transversale TaxID=64571 RepID=A0A1Y2H2C4_9FUNG|nr:hypothetical protein BCR41DRAFT_343894 [Lobosporangium transversale]ORZ28685.1 hypothetical protein BCR41DRAFT_343894 [Lobosporangium transversale]|eukprot:XP_021886358.1 hypothetical protein BCR41DRAFT_343894 [Lobosporangium transversale]